MSPVADLRLSREYVCNISQLVEFCLGGRRLTFAISLARRGLVAGVARGLGEREKSV